MSDITVRLGGQSMDITRGTLYAVYVLIYFHMRPRGYVADLRTIAETLEVPDSYLSKVLQQLHKSGLLVSVMGSKGGYRLSRDVSGTTMRDVMHVLQGESLIQQCLLGEFDCSRFRKCSVLKHVREIQMVVDQMLDRLTISQLASEMGFTEEQQKALDQISLGVQ